MVSLPRIQNDRLMFFLLFPIRQCKTIRWCWRFPQKYYVLSPNPKQAVGVGFLAHNMVSHPGTLSEALVLVLVLRTWFSIRESRTSRWYSLAFSLKPWCSIYEKETNRWNWHSFLEYGIPIENPKQAIGVPTESPNRAVGAGGPA